MDECKHCMVRGDVPACEKTKCNIHESWYVQQLLARHNALEKDHDVSLMMLARERVQRDALLTLRDTDEWRSGVAIGGHIVSKFVAERELKTLKNSHNALVDAVMNERMLESAQDDFDTPDDHFDALTAARAEVDRLLTEGDG